MGTKFGYLHMDLDSNNSCLLYKVVQSPMYACLSEMYDIFEHDKKTITILHVTKDERAI